MVLERYTNWLKENRLQQLALKNLEIARNMDLALLNFFEHMPEDELLEVLMQTLSDFLESVTSGKTRDYLQQTIQEWEENKLQYKLPTHAIQPSDIILANNAQNRAVLTFIPEFTDNIDTAITIVSELSEYYARAGKLGLEALVRIREKSEESFHLLVSSIQDAAIFRLDTKGYIQTWNPGAQRLKGYTEDEIIGKHFSIFYSDDDIRDKKPERELQKVIAEGKYEEEGWRIRKDKSRFWAKVIITPIYDAHKILVGFAKFTEDLTARVNYERSLTRKNQELSRFISETSQFARVTAHELKEPLHVISTFVRMLQKHYEDDQHPNVTESKYRRTIFEKTQLMRSQLDAMQEFMSIEVSNTGNESSDLNRVLTKTKALLSKQIEESAATIEYEHLPTVPYAKSQMITLFRNLVDNAIKFRRNEQAPRIKIAANSQGGMWLFSVEDNGIEIEQQYSEKIFEMFRRLHIRGAYPGLGMGLAICKKIVELNDGKIWVETQPGIGNKFVFTLPKEMAAVPR